EAPPRQPRGGGCSRALAARVRGGCPCPLLLRAVELAGHPRTTSFHRADADAPSLAGHWNKIKPARVPRVPIDGRREKRHRTQSLARAPWGSLLENSSAEFPGCSLWGSQEPRFQSLSGPKRKGRHQVHLLAARQELLGTRASTLKSLSSRARWRTQLGRLRQEDQKFKASLSNEEVQSNLVRPCLLKNTK
ncbi:hypothetical protein H1C71_041493, partial [Ictidomys tridecemlineatus]